MISLSSYVRRNDKLVWRIIDNYVFIMDPTTSMLHTLNGVGSRIWELLDSTNAIEEIVQEICSEFEVTSEIAREDVLKFVSELAQREMLTVDSKLLTSS